MALATGSVNSTNRIIIDLTTSDVDDDDDDENESVNGMRNSAASNLDIIPVSQTQWLSANSINQASLQDILRKPFAGNVIISSRSEAMRKAQLDSNRPTVGDRLVFWTDGSVSKAKRTCGVAVIYGDHNQPHHYVERAWSIENIIDNNQVELFGIAEAMKIAVKICRKTAEALPTGNQANVLSVTIYTDSTTALDMVSKVYRLSDASKIVIPRQAEIAKIRQRAQHLQRMGVLVNLRWVPGHSGVKGNERADKLAGQASMVRQRQVNKIFEEMIPRNDPLSIRNRSFPRTARNSKAAKLANRVGRRNAISATERNMTQGVQKVSQPQSTEGQTAGRFQRLFNRLRFQDTMQSLKDMISGKS